MVMEMVPAELATQITGKLTIPTVGIGAGPSCDAQVLVWHDMAGSTGRTARFVKRFGEVGAELRRAAMQYADEVAINRSRPRSTASARSFIPGCASGATLWRMPKSTDASRHVEMETKFDVDDPPSLLRGPCPGE